MIAADVARGGAALGHQPVQHRHRVIGVDPAAALDRERLAGVLVNDMQQLEVAPVSGLVEVEIL